MEPNIGIDSEDRATVADALKQTLADTYALYQTTHLYHWNVRGPRFAALHVLFETQYTELWEALDLIAERIRALDVLAPSHAELSALTSLQPANDPAPSEDAMLKWLADGNETVVRSARAALEAAEEAGDAASADLLTQRCTAGEKAAWMLRAHVA